MTSMVQRSMLTALMLAAFGFIREAQADPMLTLTSPANLTTLTVGQKFEVDVTLSGLAVGSDFIFDLNSKVLFSSTLFTPISDPNNRSGLTPGSVFQLPSTQVPNFNATSSLNAGNAVGNFSDDQPNSSVAIARNGLYFSFILQANSVGSGMIAFDTAATMYAADSTGFNFAPMPTSGPLSFTISPSSVPEPASLMLLGAGLIGVAGFVRRSDSAHVVA